jgi:hypothetical protein
LLSRVGQASYWSEAGHIYSLVVPVLGTNLLVGLVNPTYTIKSLSTSGGPTTTLATSAGNDGTFIATATTLYYDTWQQTTDDTAMTITQTNTASGIVGLNGTGPSGTAREFDLRRRGRTAAVAERYDHHDDRLRDDLSSSKLITHHCDKLYDRLSIYRRRRQRRHTGGN